MDRNRFLFDTSWVEAPPLRGLLPDALRGFAERRVTVPFRKAPDDLLGPSSTLEEVADGGAACVTSIGLMVRVLGPAVSGSGGRRWRPVAVAQASLDAPEIGYLPVDTVCDQVLSKHAPRSVPGLPVVEGHPDVEWSHEITSSEGVHWVTFWRVKGHMGLGFAIGKGDPAALAAAYAKAPLSHDKALKAWREARGLAPVVEERAVRRPALGPVTAEERASEEE